MIARRIVVLGAGVSGLATSLLLAREGHRVTLLERDGLAPGDPADAFAWERAGISHFHQPHAFIPRGRKELIDHLGDVYDSLIREGAYDVDVRPRIAGPSHAEDVDLQYLAVRRPLIEWALRKAVSEQPGIAIRARTVPRGFQIDRGAIAGVQLERGTHEADVVIDAMGRRSPARQWLTETGHAPAKTEQSDCGVLYYSRYYRLRPGRSLPDGPWLLGPRGDLGYMGFSTFPGDNRTFAAVLAVPIGVAELKVFHQERAHEAALASIPALRQWTDPELAEPITPVLSMGGLMNSIDRSFCDRPVGLFTVGDAVCHTDPVLAHGLSFALIHAIGVARALRTNTALADAGAAFASAVTPWMHERYRLATALDEQRLRMWTGGAVDFAHRGGDYELFSLVAGGAVASSDPAVCRMFVRRFGLLDSTKVLDDDIETQRGIETRFGEWIAKPRPPQGPARDAMLELVKEALAS